MRQIGTVSSARDAKRLADYLLTKGIRCRIDPADAEAAVWVYDEDQRDEATRELDEFKEHPADPRYDEASRQARELERKAEAEEKRYRKNVVELRTALGLAQCRPPAGDDLARGAQLRRRLDIGIW